MQWGRAFTYAFAYVSSVAGAGFFSGREIDTFFLRPGPNLLAMGLAASLFAGLGFVVTDLLYVTRAASHRDLLRRTMGTLAPFGDLMLVVFVFLTFSAVEAGAGSFLHDVTGLPAFVGAALSGAAVVGVTVVGGRAVPGIQSGLVLLMMLVLIGTARSLPRTGSIPALPLKNGTPGLIWSVLYVGYNVVLATSALPPQVQRTAHLPSLRLGAVLGGLTLGGAVFLLGDIIERGAEGVHRHALPLWATAATGPSWLPAAVGAALAAATLSALFSYLSALSARLPLLRRPAPMGIVWLMSLPLASSGLMALVGVAYPIMAVLSLGFLGLFVARWWTGGWNPER